MPFDLRLVPLFAASAASLALGLVAWRRRAPGARAFAVLLFAIAEWAATYAMEMVATDLPGKLFWEQLTYLGSATVAPAWLMFTLGYTDWRPGRGRRTVMLLLAIEPLLDQALVWTNQVHALMWTYAGFDALDLSMPLKFEYGPAYWVLLIYTYAVLLLGVWLIARTLVQSGRLYSRQSLALLLGLAAPLVANVLYNADVVGTIDPTAFAFTITGFAFFWGFQRLGLLDLAPVARNSIFRVLHDAVLVLDPLDRVVDLNPAAERVLGRTATAAIGKPLGALLAELAVLIDGAGPPADRHEITLGSAAETHHYEVRASALRGRGAHSPVTGRVIVLADITLRKAAEESVRASHQFIQEVIANAGEGIVVYDRELRIRVWNPFMQRVTGLTAEQVLGQRVMDLQPDLTGERTALLAQAMDGATVRSGDLRFNIPQTGESGWYVATYAPRRDAGGHPDGVICILHDITDRKRAEEVLSHRAMHDTLTDLPNRALFQSRLGHAIRDARRAESGLALLVIDLDRFKDVNDTLGHGSGDRLLQELAVRWQALLQDGDTLARLGGDEFAVVLPTASGRAAVSLIAAQLQGALDCAFVLDGHSVDIGASIGIAMFPEHGRDIETLLRHADGAMYAAKRSANSKAAVYAFDLAA
jgi:diguanylate cyclase (GGDEF)-like protein/PAS domain S-box-containing protein